MGGTLFICPSITRPNSTGHVSVSQANRSNGLADGILVDRGGPANTVHGASTVSLVSDLWSLAGR